MPQDSPRILRLNGVMVSKYWPVLAPGFARSLPVGVAPTKKLLDSMLAGILSKTYDCWVIQTVRDGQVSFAGAFLTQVNIDPLSHTRILFIYSLFSVTTLTEPEWERGLDLLKQVARRAKCSSVQAHSKHPTVLKVIEKFGGSTEMRVIKLEA